VSENSDCYSLLSTDVWLGKPSDKASRNLSSFNSIRSVFRVSFELLYYTWLCANWYYFYSFYFLLLLI
jgi:hypothetical protein